MLNEQTIMFNSKQIPPKKWFKLLSDEDIELKKERFEEQKHD